MIRFPALVGLPIILTLAACAEAGEPAGPVNSPDHRSEAFQQRATVVAQAWLTGPGRQDWRSGFVPLQDPTVLPADPGFNNGTKQAFLAGWYVARGDLPDDRPADGVIRFPDGTLSVPLVSAAEAYRQIDQGDPPPCPDRLAAPTPAPSGPDGAVSSIQNPACVPLTVTRAKLDSVTVRTNRGEARVPAWLFTVSELAAPVARLAVAASAVAPVPTAPAPEPETGGEFVAAQDLVSVDGATLTYRVGVGACDHDVVPLVQQHDEVVVAAGAVTRSPGICTEQLVMAPVTVTLDRPLSARPVLDATSGRPLLLAAGR